jgi:fibronectin type 3 domain-containing protein
VIQSSAGAAVATTAGLGFDGVGNGFVGPQGSFTVNVAPPDTNGAVGATQFVQFVNSSFAVFDKNTGTTLYGPAAGNTLWSGFGTPCQTTNDGDVIVQYDKVAGRWILSQLSFSQAPPYYLCVAVSTGSDATGTYNRYAFSYSDLNDYPKIGVWPDAYYVSYNMFHNNIFVGSKVCALDRSAMLAGSTGTQQCFQLTSSFGGLLPADLDGTTPPPTGSPNYFLNFGFNSLNVWQFRVNWTNSSQTTLSGPINIAVAGFTEACGGGTCIPQSGTRQQLDSLGDRLMYRLAYRNFGDHEALVVNHSVTAASSVGVRWYEIRNPAAPTVYQQGTYAPDSNYRWMGSIGMDHVGDIALGYSVSSSTMHPAVRYTGRVPSDISGTLQGETSIVEGTGSQTTNLSRWGDYSSINVDPIDDCTFWYTNEYLKGNGTFNWSTRIASFKFPSCATSPPAAPVGLTATAGNGQVSLSWNPSTGATSYNVLRSTTNGGPYTAIATGLTVTTYTDTGLTNGTTYYYVVQAVNSAGTSPNSNQASATPIAPPPPPTGLTATAGNTQVALTWTASSTARTYNVLRSTTNGGPYATVVTSLTATSYTDTGLTNGTTYYYVVQAVNGAGTSANSNQTSATPTAPPLAPTGFVATAGNAQVKLTWTASSSATSYNVLRSTTNGGPYSNIAGGVATTNYTDTGLTNGTTYYYVVQAVNSAGTSPNSNQASATPIAPPPAPTGLTATAGNAQVSLNWSASSNATSYNVLRSATNGGPYTTVIAGLTTTSYTDTGLSNGTNYYYVVQAVNSIGNSPNSNQASATPMTAGTIATFVSTDTTTEGNWRGVYGTDGYSVANDSQSLPSYASFAIQNQQNYTWAATTTDPRALQTGSGTGRIASTWYNSSTFSFDVNFIDGGTHRFALYALDWDSTTRTETIQIVDANSNAVLDTRNISQFNTGVYLVWNISGHVKINVTWTGGANAVISGAFFGGSSGSETVSVTPPSITLGASQQRQFAATVSGTSNQTVSWSITSVNPPTASSGNISSTGLYTAPATITQAQVTIKATSADGTASGTATVNLTTGAVASFVSSDTSTEGSWHGVYGADGYSVANDSQSLPSYASFAVQNQGNYTWAATTTDPRAPQTGSGTGRIASTWYNSSTFSFDVNFIDGGTHRFALYALDWDSTTRTETIQIVDANSNAVLDTRNISQFNTGVYLVWNISGHVKINVTWTGGANAVISGAFFGGSSGSETVSVTPPSITLGASQQRQFAATVSGTSNQTVSWSITSVNPPTASSGNISSTGLYTAPATITQAQVTIKATSADGTASGTATVNLTTGAVASFVSSDTSTEGSWHGVYGADGYSVANDSQSLPSYASFAVQNQGNYTWAATTTDPRAPQTGSGTGRIASTWYNSSTFSFDVNFIDGGTHRFALYALDWDSTTRTETIQIVDANSNAVLDTRNISQFNTGVYLVWNISGHVKINVTWTGGANAVISGVFFN